MGVANNIFEFWRSGGDRVPTKTNPKATEEVKPEAIKADRTFDLAKAFTKYVFFVMGIIIIGSMAVIGTPLIMKSGVDYSTAYENTKDLLGVLLPVLSTWVGTILAFYFTKENFAAATKSSIDLHKALNPVQEKLTAIEVTDAMLDIGEATTLTLEKEESKYSLQDLLDALRGKERLPMVDKQGAVKYLAHRSLINRFIVDHQTEGTNPTLVTMVNDVETRKMLTGFGVLSNTANLADAKALIDKSKYCQDVFVTEDGTREGKAMGWVTNVIVQEQAQL